MRVVTKSLPSIPLLRHAMDALGTDRLMVFDDSLAALAGAFPDADLMLGKPLPVRAAERFYEQRRQAGAPGDPGARVRWLVDGPARLAHYAQLARGLGVTARIAIEIDVGLHRGGVASVAELTGLLRAIASEGAHLRFAGLMGYEPHGVSRAWARWDPNRALSYFIFGGGWMARPVSPAGLVDNGIFGFSTNQAMLNGSRRTALEPDDWIFLRPTQSERVLQEFPELRLLRGGELSEESWAALPFGS